MGKTTAAAACGNENHVFGNIKIEDDIRELDSRERKERKKERRWNFGFPCSHQNKLHPSPPLPYTKRAKDIQTTAPAMDTGPPPAPDEEILAASTQTEYASRRPPPRQQTGQTNCPRQAQTSAWFRCRWWRAFLRWWRRFPCWVKEGGRGCYSFFFWFMMGFLFTAFFTACFFLWQNKNRNFFALFFSFFSIRYFSRGKKSFSLLSLCSPDNQTPRRNPELETKKWLQQCRSSNDRWMQREQTEEEENEKIKVKDVKFIGWCIKMMMIRWMLNFASSKENTQQSLRKRADVDPLMTKSHSLHQQLSGKQATFPPSSPTKCRLGWNVQNQRERGEIQSDPLRIVSPLCPFRHRHDPCCNIEGVEEPAEQEEHEGRAPVEDGHNKTVPLERERCWEVNNNLQKQNINEGKYKHDDELITLQHFHTIQPSMWDQYPIWFESDQFSELLPFSISSTSYTKNVHPTANQFADRSARNIDVVVSPPLGAAAIDFFLRFRCERSVRMMTKTPYPVMMK